MLKPDNPALVFPRYVGSGLEGLAVSFLYFDSVLLPTPAGSVRPTPEHVMERWPRVRAHLTDEAATLLTVCLTHWSAALHDVTAAAELLEPLCAQGTILFPYLAYPAGSAAWQEIEETFDRRPDLAVVCDKAVEVPVACSEFVRHVFLELLLELKMSCSDLASYLNSLLRKHKWDDVLIRSMALRFNAIAVMKGESVLCTSLQAARALSEWGEGEQAGGDIELSRTDIADVVACEIFHRVLHPALSFGSLTRKRVERLAKLRGDRYAELCNLRERCFELGTEVDAPLWTPEMLTQVQKVVRRRLEKPVADMLHLNTRSARDYFASLLEDKLFWVTLVGFVGGLFAGASGVPAPAAPAGASGVLCVTASKAVSALRRRSQKLEESELSFVYYAQRQL